MPSHTMVMAPIIGALVKAENMLGPNRVWTHTNAMQQTFLMDYFNQRDQLAKFSEEELKSWASYVASELNAILKKEGFDIELNDFAPNEFGVVSILNVLVEWILEGTKDTVYTPADQAYPAVRIKTDGDNVKVFDATNRDHPHPVIQLKTKSGDNVFITIAKHESKQFMLLREVDLIRMALKPMRTPEEVIFPMVDLNQNVDIGWLTGMHTTNQNDQPYEIARALQQTKLKMNHQGARVKSAVAIVMRCLSLPSQLVIDRPFYLWIEREGISTPILVAYIDEYDWKDPGTLTM